MSLIRCLQKIRYIDYLISKKSTGSQTELARKTRLSISGLNNYLKEMRELGFPIQFCRKQKTYYYTDSGKMVDSLFEHQICLEQMQEVKGGCNEITLREGDNLFKRYLIFRNKLTPLILE